MKKITEPVPADLLLDELTEERFVRQTNNGGNEIYVIDAHNSPNLMKEIGRLREITFREAGGGTGKDIDIDQFDISEIPFQQLIVWEPEDKAIIGGYRFILCRNLGIDKERKVQSPTASLFKFSELFIRDYLPVTVELGRSFVQPNYQPMFNIRKGMYSLDNLWDGLGAVIVDNPDIKYLFGKITMYPHYNNLARDMILFFLDKYFHDDNGLLTAYESLSLSTDEDVLDHIFNGGNYDADYKILVHHVRSLKEAIPPLVNAYMNLSSTMITFGTAVNHHFGEVFETGIIITINDIYEIKKERHVASYKK